MKRKHGSYVWYELMTEGVDAAEEFYRDVAGWTVQPSGMEGMRYDMFKAGEDMVAGVMDIPADAKAMGARPQWIGYVRTDTLDASVARARDLGAHVYAGPQDIPGVGRFAMLGDPDRATFAMFEPLGAPENDFTDMQPGHFGWNELFCADIDKAMAFYGALFGWEKGETIPTPGGPYQLFTHQGQAKGGMMKLVDGMPMANWSSYINVASVTEASARAVARGAKMLHDIMEVPGGAWVIKGVDPQGAVFALLGGK